MANGIYAADGSYNVTVLGSGSGTTASQVQGNVAAGTADSGNPVKIGGVYYASSAPALADGQRGNLRVSSSGIVLTNIASDLGTPVLITHGSTDGNAAVNGLNVASFGYTWNGTAWDRITVPNATSRIVSAAATTNATSAKASSGKVFTITGYNAAAALRYLKLYNKATAPTVGTDTPTHTFALTATKDFQIKLDGRYFSTGIAYALTTSAADADTGALTAADILGLNIDYA